MLEIQHFTSHSSFHTKVNFTFFNLFGSSEKLQSIKLNRRILVKMLTFEENRWNFQVIQILCDLNFLSIQINRETGKIRRSNQTRRRIWNCFLSLAIFHWIHGAFRLVQSILIPEYFKFDHFVLHFIVTIAYSCVYSSVFLVFVRNPEEFVMTFNRLFHPNPDEAEEYSDALSISIKSMLNKVDYVY